MRYDHEKDYRFIEVMSALGEASGQESTPFKEKIYAQGLDDIPIEQIQAAAWALIKTRTFASFPKIGEIRDAVGGRAEDQAEVQAALVWQSVKRYGATRSVVFDDPTTMAVVQQCFGGWQKMCSELMEDQLQWFLKDFSRHYIAFKRSGVKHYGALPGWADPVGKGPALIGDPVKAEKVFLLGQSNASDHAFDPITQIAEKMSVR